jgi:flagellar protein FlbD
MWRLNLDDIAPERPYPGKTQMILLTKINKTQIIVNSDLIQYVEETPDTVITMANYDKVVVLESMSEIIEKVICFRRHINSNTEIHLERQREEFQ